jgi:hypothetical protein
LDDDKMPDQPISSSAYKFYNGSRESSPGTRGKADKKNAAAGSFVGIDQLAKVLIFNDKDAFFADCLIHHNLVVCARRNFRDSRHVVTGSAKSPTWGCVADACHRCYGPLSETTPAPESGLFRGMV